jgi:hypothetical protein
LFFRVSAVPSAGEKEGEGRRKDRRFSRSRCKKQENDGAAAAHRS